MKKRKLQDEEVIVRLLLNGDEEFEIIPHFEKECCFKDEVKI